MPMKVNSETFKLEFQEIIEENGAEVKNGELIYACAYCSPSYCYVPNQSFKILNKQAYCMNHYATAVDVYLADKKLEQSK